MKNLELIESVWGTCSNCENAGEGVCDCCPNEEGEIQGITEITENGTCENWKRREE